MKYHILTDGTTIASFIYKCDRDLCKDALEEMYPDTKFDAVEEDE